MKLAVPILLLAGTFLFAADGKADAVKRELKLLESNWRRVSTERDNVVTPAHSKWEFQGDHEVEITAQGGKLATFRIAIDPTKKPKTIEQSFDMEDFESQPMIWHLRT